MAIRLSSAHQVYSHEVTQIESDVNSLVSNDIKSITPSGTNPNTLLADIKSGKVLLLSDTPKAPLFQYNEDQQLIVSDHNVNQHASLLNSLSSRFTWLSESEAKDPQNDATDGRHMHGVANAPSGSSDSSLSPSKEVVYSEPSVVKTPEPFKWTIFINEELYRFSTKHHDLNHGLPVRIEDDQGGVINTLVDGYKVTVMLSDSVSELTLTFFPEGNDPKAASEKTWPDTAHKKMLGNSVKFTQSDWHEGKPGVVSLRIPAAKGAILHPSLTCPVLGNPNQAQPVSLLLALEKGFITNQFEQDKDTEEGGNGALIGGPWVRRAIHTQLCCNPITQQKNTKQPNDLPLFKRHSIAVDSMQVYHLGSLTGERQLIKNHKGEAWTVLRESSAKWYTEKSFTELVQVDIDPTALASLAKGSSALYDLAWTCLNQDGEAFFITPDKGAYPDNPHIEQQDIEQNSWHQQGKRYKQGVYSLDSIKDCNRDNINTLSIDTSVNEKGESPSVKQRHPLYLSTKPLLNPGQLTDVHISSRQHIYTASKAQVIPGASPKDSPYLGDLCNINFLTLKNLMDQMGKNKEVDVLVFTGDLVDYCVNLDPEQCQDVSNTGGIWEHMTEAKEQDETIYPKYIDDLMAFGLFDYFLVTYKKPIILISGNHEAYDMPYGISPRLYGTEYADPVVNTAKAIAKKVIHTYMLIPASVTHTGSVIEEGLTEAGYVKDLIIQRLDHMLNAEQPKNLSDLNKWFTDAITSIESELQEANQKDEKEYQSYLDAIENAKQYVDDKDWNYGGIFDYVESTATFAAEKYNAVDLSFNKLAYKMEGFTNQSIYTIQSSWKRLTNFFTQEDPADTAPLETKRMAELNQLEQDLKHKLDTIRQVRADQVTSTKGFIDDLRVNSVDMRANAGIPADHNLTIYEACLLYGNEYAHLNKTFNFEKANFEWFYQVFCPMSDFILNHDKQQWVGLEWGDGEDFMYTSLIADGGELPRATQSCNDEQLQLVKQASKYEDKPERVLLTHFTLVNFPTNNPITNTWKINTNDVGITPELVDYGSDVVNALALSMGAPTVHYEIGDRNHGEEGSFHNGREELYQEHVLKGRFKYCLAGHSHRAGLYDVSNIQSETFDAKGMLPHNYVPNTFPDDQPRILVSGSGGPVSKQNQIGELAGLGMDASQGTWIDVTKDEFHVVTADKNQVPQAHPRFSVALDYMDLEGGAQPFASFGSTNLKEGVFEIVLNNTLPKEKFIDKIKLHYVDSTSFAPVGQLTWEIKDGQTDSGQTTLTLTSKEWKTFYKQTRELKGTLFNKLGFYLSVHFNEKLSDSTKYPTYQGYRYDTPWCYPVTLLKGDLAVENEEDNTMKGYCRIARRGDEPNKKEYKDLRDNIVEYAV